MKKMIFKEETITNRLCYLLLGLCIGFGVGFSLIPEPTTKSDSINIILQKDSIKEAKMVKKPVALNEKTLKEELIKNNIPHKDIVLAQAKLESAHFKSDLVKNNQNIFGLKKGNRYRKYSHWTECVKDYKKCISDRYSGGNYYAFLKRINYSEDKEYINILKEMV